MLTVIQKGNVKNKAKAQKIHDAKNFPQTRAVVETGIVMIWTMLLLRNSSAHKRMDIPGIKSKYNHG